MTKTLAKIWLTFVASLVVLGNGVLCYNFHELLAYEVVCFGVSFVLYLTAISLIEISEE